MMLYKFHFVSDEKYEKKYYFEFIVKKNSDLLRKI